MFNIPQVDRYVLRCNERRFQVGKLFLICRILTCSVIVKIFIHSCLRMIIKKGPLITFGCASRSASPERQCSGVESKGFWQWTAWVQILTSPLTVGLEQVLYLVFRSLSFFTGQVRRIIECLAHGPVSLSVDHCIVLFVLFFNCGNIMHNKIDHFNNF